MPKLRRQKNKHLPRGKKRKERQISSVEAIQKQVTDQNSKSVPRSSVSLPLMSESVLKGKPISIRYPYIAGELSLIGILTAIILVIMVVLARVI